MIGMMVRVIRFQSSLKLMGMTGWTLSTYCVALFGPTPKLKLFWKGNADQLGHGVLRGLGQLFLTFLAFASASAASRLPGSQRQGERAIETVLAVVRTARVADGLAVEVEAGRKRGQQWQGDMSQFHGFQA